MSSSRQRGPVAPPPPLAVPVVDAHCHLDVAWHGEAAGADGGWLAVADAVELGARVGVPRIVQIGCDLASARWSVEMARRHDAVVAAVALHPNEVPALASRGELDDALAEIDRLAASSDRVRAIGETGLDHFRTPEEHWRVQEDGFRAHIALAKKHGLALQIHDRDAHDDILRVLEEEGAPERVVFHCFSGDAAMARWCADRGYVLSYAGTVTFANAPGLREAAAVTPLDQLLVETDAPYLAPAPYRGRPNASYLIPVTLRRLAEVKGVQEDELCEAVAATAERMFGAW